jgi:ABC-type Fe3+/spermidine/putrescine transport system ATPase subunit
VKATTETDKIRPRAGAQGGPDKVFLENVTKQYGAVVALKDVTLTVGDGEFVTLLGPSGSGKTTCLQIMAGIARPDSGVIRIAGKDVVRVPMHKRNIGMVFQNYALFPNMTVAGNVLYPLRMRGWGKEDSIQAMRDALALVRLEGYEARKPDQLSGGQQQRVALARAIVFKPSVLLLDEPLSALDRLLREEMQLELRRVHELTGMATVCVTHDRTEALTMSDRVVLLNKGSIVQEGTPREMYDRPASVFAAAFLGEVNRMRMTLSGDRGARVLEDGQGRRITGVEPYAGAESGPADVAIRVENVHLSHIADSGTQPGAWEGTIRNAVFLGDGDRYLVDCGDLPLVARVARGAGTRAFASGDRVSVRFASEDVTVFPAE